MIAVLADDFTGAAELAGISLVYFNKVQVGMQYVPEKSDAEVLIICSDSRSVPEKEAVQITAAILEKILPFHPFFIYKKTDSVLRGHVIAELKIQMEQSKLSKALYKLRYFDTCLITGIVTKPKHKSSFPLVCEKEDDLKYVFL